MAVLKCTWLLLATPFCLFLFSFTTSLSMAHSTQSHWCPCLFFKHVEVTTTSTMPPHCCSHRLGYHFPFWLQVFFLTHSHHLIRKAYLKTLHTKVHSCLSLLPSSYCTFILIIYHLIKGIYIFWLNCLSFQIEYIPHETGALHL